MSKILKFSLKNHKNVEFISLENDGPKYEMVCTDDDDFAQRSRHEQNNEPLNYRRARVLCSYDAKDNTELNLVANEVNLLIFKN